MVGLNTTGVFTCPWGHVQPAADLVQTWDADAPNSTSHFPSQTTSIDISSYTLPTISIAASTQQRNVPTDRTVRERKTRSAGIPNVDPLALVRLATCSILCLHSCIATTPCYSYEISGNKSGVPGILPAVLHV